MRLKIRNPSQINIRANFLSLVLIALLTAIPALSYRQVDNFPNRQINISQLEFAKFYQAEIVRYGKVVNETNLKESD